MEFFVKGTEKEISMLHGLLDTDVKFSKSRCGKVLPRALQTYQDGLPQHYTRSAMGFKIQNEINMRYIILIRAISFIT